MSIKNLNYFLSITGECSKCGKELSAVVDPFGYFEFFGAFSKIGYATDESLIEFLEYNLLEDHLEKDCKKYLKHMKEVKRNVSQIIKIKS